MTACNFHCPHLFPVTRKTPAHQPRFSALNYFFPPRGHLVTVRSVESQISFVPSLSISRSQEKHRRREEMKEGKRSESDKEKTKMRERQRRAITTNIFHGLRKHGGYRLSPRADINEVLRQLAHEAGWVILPDGTTYRAKVSSSCPLCGAPQKTAAATNPTSNGGPVIGAGGECSTMALGAPVSSIKDGPPLFCIPESLNDSCRQPISVPVYTYQVQELTGEAQSSNGEDGRNSSDGGIGEGSGMTMTSCQQKEEFLNLEDKRRSNQRTMMGSPPYE